MFEHLSDQDLQMCRSVCKFWKTVSQGEKERRKTIRIKGEEEIPIVLEQLKGDKAQGVR